jgi:hypothetical protein
MLFIALVLAANPHLDEARKLYEQLKYPEAVARLRVALTVPTNTAVETQQITDLLARSLIAQGHTADAEKAWAELLAVQPDAADPVDASPKIRDVFLRAKRSVYPADFVKLERGPSPPEMLEATLTDPWRQVDAVSLRCGEDVKPLPVASHVSARLPENVPCSLDATHGGKALATVAATYSKAAVAVAAAPAGGPATEVEAAPPGPSRPWPAYLLTALAIGALAASAVLAGLSWMDYQQVTPMTSAVDTRTLDASSRTKAGAAWGALGGALTCGVLALVVALRW